ncbi:MAG: L-threonylcarbamoyladenylate synthase [bacterium]
MRTVILDIEKASRHQLMNAALAVRRGAVAVFPTDTVYGIGTGAFSKKGIRKIYSLKGRPPSKPLPILIDSVASLKKLAVWDKKTATLALRFWPGALTLILKNGKAAPGRLKGLSGIGARRPDYKPLITWIKMLKVPLASTSANISGRPALKRAADVLAVFEGKADYIFLGGNLPGTESTVADMTREKPVVLREGAVPGKKIISALAKLRFRDSR